jgi:hypothetical protein
VCICFGAGEFARLWFRRTSPLVRAKEVLEHFDAAVTAVARSSNLLLLPKLQTAAWETTVRTLPEYRMLPAVRAVLCHCCLG